MDEELYKKLDELFLMLDNNIYLKNLSNIKKAIPDNIKKAINTFRENPTLDNKRKLYKNDIFNEYIKNETELNYLIIAINNKFKKKRGQCAHN